MAFFTTPAFVVPKLVQPQERPSRWRLTYAFELQVMSLEGGVMKRGANRVVNLPINPSTYNVRDNAAHNLTDTIGGVSAEENGFIRKDITVKGTCGLAPKRGWSAGTFSGGSINGGGLIFADGNTLWRELRNLFRIYGTMVRNGGPLRPRMVWHDFRNDDHWVVVPVAFDTQRNAQEHRIHYPYAIEMTAVADADTSGVPGEASIFSTARNLAAYAVGAINAVTGLAADAGAFVDEANGTINSALLGVLGAAKTMADAATGIRSGINDTLNIPKNFALAASRLVDAWRLAVDGQLDSSDPWSPTNDRGSIDSSHYEIAARMADGFDALLAKPEIFAPSWGETGGRAQVLLQGERLLSQSEIEAASRPTADPATLRGMTARATPGAATRRNAGIGESRALAVREYQSQRAYVVQSGDTIFGIAAREMGSAQYWQDIALLNGLSVPFISELRLPNTAWVGDTVMIPQLTSGPETAIANNESDAEEIALGVDIYLGTDGRWEVNPATGDLRLARGLENFDQALRMRYSCQIGSNLVFPDYGILTPVGEANGAGVPEAIALSVRRATFADSRVEEITDLVIEDTGDGAVVELTVVPRGFQGRVQRRAVE